MTNQEQIIAPSLELVHQWADMLSSRSDHAVFSLATQWGADQELEACCVLMDEWGLDGEDLMQCRRPKPPNLTEQAFEALEEIDSYAIQQMSAYAIHSELKIYAETIRDALERLKKLEESTND